MELDLAQFLSKPSGALVLRADSLPAEKITAPSGAVRIHPQVIAEQTGISPDELLGGGDLPATDAHTIAGYVGEDISGMAADDGAAPSLDYLQQAIQDMDGIADGLVIAPVGTRVQVTLNGRSACLALPATADGSGTVTDGPCA